jgi:hypothetical protein
LEIIMSTRSAIIIEEMEGRSRGIYCHSDGYVSHHKPILLGRYANEELARQLVELGMLSTLGPSIGQKCDFENRPRGQCVAYGRDRGETGKSARPIQAEDWLKVAQQIGHDGHVYVFRVTTQSWWYEGMATGAINGHPRGGKRFVPLVRVKSESGSPSPRQKDGACPR